MSELLCSVKDKAFIKNNEQRLFEETLICFGCSVPGLTTRLIFIFAGNGDALPLLGVPVMPLLDSLIIH